MRAAATVAGLALVTAVAGCTTISIYAPSAEECEVLEAALNYISNDPNAGAAFTGAAAETRVSSLALPWAVMSKGGHVGQGRQVATELQACPWFERHARAHHWTLVQPPAYRRLLPGSGNDLVWITRPERLDDGSYEVYLGSPGLPAGPVVKVERKGSRWTAESAGFLVSGE